MPLVWVFLGGGLGSVARWGFALLFPQPWATVAVNLIGSFAIAFLAHPSTGLDATNVPTSLGSSCFGAKGVAPSFSVMRAACFSGIQPVVNMLPTAKSGMPIAPRMAVVLSARDSAANSA